MDLEVIKQNGEKFLLSDYDVVVQDIKIYSIPMLYNRQRIDGFAGSLSYGTEYGDRKIEVTATFIAKDLHDYAHLRDELFNLLNDSNGYYIRELRRLNKKQYDFIGLNEKPKEKTGTDNSYVNGKQYHVDLDGDFDFEQDNVYGSTTINFKTSGLPFAESIYTTKELHDTKYNAKSSNLITDRDRERFSDISVGRRNLLLDSENRNLALKSDVPYNNSNYLIAEYTLSKSMEFGKTYTITVKGNVENSNGGLAILRDNGRYFISSNADKISDDLYQTTFEATNDTYVTDNIRLYNYPRATRVSADIEWIKLEEGNIGTDWTPAPEDFETYDDYIMWFVNSGNFQLEKDGVYGLADDIHVDYQKYVFEEDSFSVYNAGNVEIEPESMYINIIVSGLNGEIEIKNLTTGQMFKLEKSYKGILELKGMSTKVNGTNIFRDTNKRLINLAVGKNDFEVTGKFKDITFDFKYYYK